MFSLNSKFKKFIVTIFVILLVLIPALSPFTTQAYIFTDVAHIGVSIFNWGKEIYKNIVDEFRWWGTNFTAIATRLLMQQFTKSIVAWIDSGFQGNPSFITDPSKFFGDIADLTVGDYILNNKDLAFLCDPFKLKIKLDLGLQFSRPSASSTGCSFTSAVGNANDAMNNFIGGDFSGSGAWDSWLQISTQPQNNYLGAMVITQGQLSAKLETSQETKVKEIDLGSGFMSFKKCTRNYYDIETNEYFDSEEFKGDPIYQPNAYEDDETVWYDDDCESQTPGVVLANKVGWADTSDMRQIELAKDFNAILGALANYAANAVADMAKGLLARKDDAKKGQTVQQIQKSYNQAIAAAQADANRSIASYNAGAARSLTTGARVARQEELRPGSANLGAFATEMTGIAPFSSLPSNAQTIFQDQVNDKLTRIDSYIEAQLNLYNLFTAVKRDFSTSTCTTAEKDAIVFEIDAATTSLINIGTNNLAWNIKNISGATTTASSTVNALSNALNTLIATPNMTTQGLNSLASSLAGLNIPAPIEVQRYSAGGDIYTNITNWVIGKINNSSCGGSLNITNLNPWGISRM